MFFQRDLFTFPRTRLSAVITNAARYFLARIGYNNEKPMERKNTRRRVVFSTYTAKYIKLEKGYMGQLVEWPEVITEGKTLEECRAMLQDALQEMIRAYRQQKRKSLPAARCWSKSPPSSRCPSRAGNSSAISRQTVSFFFGKEEPLDLHEWEADDSRKET